MILTWLWLLPVLGGVAVVMAPPRFGKWLGVIVAAVTLALSIGVAIAFHPGATGYQFEEMRNWIPALSVFYHLGVDGISLWLVVLNALIGLVAVLATPVDLRRSPRFIGLMLLMQGGMTGVFLSVDLLLFYFFWEAMLIPAYFLLWLWGEGQRPVAAALKFVLYTLAGSLLMLVGVIGEYALTSSHSFQLTELAQHPPDAALQFGLFFLFAIAFAIKVPLFPFHSWLPTAYLSAPTPMLLAFAGVMGKTGAYAMLRILIPLFPHPVLWWNWQPVMVALAVAGIAWGALMALTQRDLRGVIAYSSVSHMGFIVLGIFALNVQGQQGAVIQMVNHGLIVPALFLLVAFVAERTGTRDRSVLTRLAPEMPVLAGVFLVVTLAALGLPGLNSFVGEFMILLGAWQYSVTAAVLACIGLLLAPVYMLRLFQGSMHRDQPTDREHPGAASAGTDHGPHGSGLEHGPEAAVKRDLRAAQLVLLAPLVALMFLLGAYPHLLTQDMYALGLPLPW